MQTEMLYGNGLKTKYSYDTRNQLTGIVAGVDGKASLFEAKYSYNGNGNRITKDEQILYGLDTHITSFHTEYSYDSMNHLTGENLNGTLTSYSYDLTGNRTTKTVEGRKESYLYNSRNQLTELISEDKKICYSYDNVENYYQYSAFGENLVREEKVSNRLRYNAQIEDDLTGLYYLRARYYNPMTGRFTQEDVIYNDGLNLYAYCNSNPVMYGDWTGCSKEPVPFNMGKYNYSDIYIVLIIIVY